MENNCLPVWLSTEQTVQRTFELLGFEVIKISIHGRQIDLIATKSDTFNFSPETWIVEITTEKVGQQKGAIDSQKLLLAAKNYPNAKMLLLSTGGFTDDQKQTLQQLNIHAMTYTEMESCKVNLRKYAINALATLKNSSVPDIGYDPKKYIDPDLTIVNKNNSPEISMSGSEWIDTLFNSSSPAVYSVIGNLGSGKTSVLQRALEIGCTRFLDDSEKNSIPIYIPLGRYKQHSGDLEQMLMSELKRAGQDSYPIGLMRHLIDNNRIVLLLDGLDEVYPIQNSEDVLSTVTQLLASIGKHAVAVISCRRQFMETSAEELAYFGSYTIAKLQDIQVGLAMRLRGHPTTYITNLLPFDRPKIDKYFSQHCGMTKTEVDNFFSRFYGFEDMAQTPVLLSMMATAIQEDLICPTDNAQFPLLNLYRTYTNRWIERDAQRNRLSGNQRRQLSEDLASHMFWAARDSELWPQIREILCKHPAWRETPLSDDEASLEIRKSGFLTRDIDDKYRFIHRSIMEYFAAVVELRKLKNGERPRYIPSDGFRLFLSQLIAHDWISSGECPIPIQSWGHERGDSVLNMQMSLLSSSTAVLMERQKIHLNVIRKISTTGKQIWKQVIFNNLIWQHTGSDLVLKNCELKDTRITLSTFTSPLFNGCQFINSYITFTEMPKWEQCCFTLQGNQATLVTPAWVWDLAYLKSVGATIFILEDEWTLSTNHLNLFAEVVGRLRHPVPVERFIGGTYKEHIRDLLQNLFKSNWIDEDNSKPKQGKEIFLTSYAKNIINKMSSKPLECLKELEVFKVNN